MSILTELKKLTKKKNATVVSQALPDSLDGSGSGGGANVLTLYVGTKDGSKLPWGYKDHDYTEEYQSYEEAVSALANADIVKMVMPFRDPTKMLIVSAVSKLAIDAGSSQDVICTIIDPNSTINNPELINIGIYHN